MAVRGIFQRRHADGGERSGGKHAAALWGAASRRPGRSCEVFHKRSANSQVCSAFARAFLCRAVSCSERASPFPTMRCCEFAGGVLKTGALLRGAPGSACPTTWMVRIRPTGCFGFVLLRGTPGTAFPIGRLRIRRRWKQVAPVCCGASGTPPPTKHGALTHSLPPRGIGVKLKKLEVNIIYVVSW